MFIMTKFKIPLIVAGLLLVIVFFRSRVPYFQSTKDISPPLQLQALGSNSFGQLGKSPQDLEFGSITPDIPEEIESIAAGRNNSLFLTSKGKIFSWGGNEWGQLGYKTDSYYETEPKEIPNVSNIVKIATNNNHVLALNRDGAVFAFGFNFSGQIGDGTTENRFNPIQVPIDPVKDIAAGYKFSVAVLQNGDIWGWGASCDSESKKTAETWWKEEQEEQENREDGSYYDPHSEALVYYDKNEYCINEDIVGILNKVPRKIDGVQGIEKISAGYGHVLALDKNSNVWSFGCNTYNQLGRDTKGPINATPKRIEEIEGIQEVSAGFRHSLALKKDGTVLAWGHNYRGQLGDDTTNDSVHPVIVPIDHVTNVIAGYDYSLALKEDGTVWGWGRNTGHWFGDSEIEFVKIPTKISGLEHITNIALGGTHILALSKDN